MHTTKSKRYMLCPKGKQSKLKCDLHSSIIISRQFCTSRSEKSQSCSWVLPAVWRNGTKYKKLWMPDTEQIHITMPMWHSRVLLPPVNDLRSWRNVMFDKIADRSIQNQLSRTVFHKRQYFTLISLLATIPVITNS